MTLIFRQLILFCFLVLSIVHIQLVAQTVDSSNPNNDESSFVFSPDGKYLAKISNINKNTQVQILDTNNMKVAAQWQIPDFEVRELQFSASDSGKILITDKRRILVYKLSGNRQKLLFIQPELKNQEIVQAGFDLDTDEVVWATNNTVYKTNPSNRKSKELAYVNPLQSSITSFAPLKDDELAVSIANSKDLFVYTPIDSENPKVLKGHVSPVISVLSPFGDFMFSLGKNHELLVWSGTDKKIRQRLRLQDSQAGSRITKVSLDPQRRDLVVTSRMGNRETRKRYATRDLKIGRVKPVKRPDFQKTIATKNVIPTGSDETEPLDGSIRSQYDDASSSPSESKKEKKNTLYDLAKIEADNGNFDAALNFIKMLPLDDPNFKKSRELRKKIYNQIKIRNNLNAARERMQTGNLDSARVLLKNMQTQFPDDPEVTRYLSVVEGKQSKSLLIRLLVIAILLILLLLLGYLLWRYRVEVKAHIKKSPKPEGEPDETVKKVNPQRREFILLLNKTKNQLKLATLHDRDKKHLDTWLEMTAKINMIEKKAKLDDKYLSDLTDRLVVIQTKITELTGGGGSQGSTHKQSSQKTNQKHKKQTRNRSSTKEQPPREPPTEKKTPDYYQILGIAKTASSEEIKKAYREKMKEYHPDKHSSSDYDWVKSEASRMTKQIQEAYEMLSDPKK